MVSFDFWLLRDPVFLEAHQPECFLYCSTFILIGSVWSTFLSHGTVRFVIHRETETKRLFFIWSKDFRLLLFCQCYQLLIKLNDESCLAPYFYKKWSVRLRNQLRMLFVIGLSFDSLMIETWNTPDNQSQSIHTLSMLIGKFEQEQHQKRNLKESRLA